jgi:lysophospholipase L1-like esterase
MRRNLALAVIGVLLAVVCVELGLRAAAFSDRIAGPPIGPWKWIRYDPVLGYGNVPGFRVPELGVAIDSLGFRGPEIARGKAAGTVRVVCVGDSTTFGIWVERPNEMHGEAPYPAELERLARGDGLPVEVVNAGVLGQTTSGAIVQLLTQILALGPDVVTVRLGNNDHAWSHSPIAPLATRLEYPIFRAMPPFVWRLETARLVAHAYRQAIARRRAWAPGAVNVTPERFDENLRRFVTVARERGIHLAFVDFPYRELERGPSPGERFPNALQNVANLEELHRLHDGYQAIVARVAAETDTPLVRTIDALRNAPTPTFSSYDLSHPNGAGYRIVAGRLYAELRALGWLDAPAGDASRITRGAASGDRPREARSP